jgi:hypothetical protein
VSLELAYIDHALNKKENPNIGLIKGLIMIIAII